MECGLPEGEQACGEVLDSSRDKAFLAMVEELRKTKFSSDEFVGAVKDRVRLELLCRLLLLARLQLLKPDVTPLDYLLSQLNGGQAFIAAMINNLRGYPDDDIRGVLLELNSHLQPLLQRNENALHETADTKRKDPKPHLLFGFDEANVGYTKVMHGYFKSLEKGQNRGLASPIVQVVSQLAMSVSFSLVVSGTAVSLRTGDSVGSDIGKDRGALHKVFGLLAHNHDPWGLLGEFLDLSECLPDLTLLEGLCGRHRLVSRVVEDLPQHVRVAEGQLKKQDLLELALKGSIKAHTESLKSRLRSALEEGPRTSRDTAKKNAKLMDRMVVAAALFQGRVHYRADEKQDDVSTDFVELGLCGVVREADGGLAWTLTEPFAKACVEEVFQDLRNASPDSVVKLLTLHCTEQLQAVIRTLGCKTTARGLLVEPLEFVPFLGKDYQNKKVGEIPLLERIQERDSTLKLPPWCGEVIFQAKEFGDAVKFSIKKGGESEFLASASAVHRILSPSHGLRPDGVLMLTSLPKRYAFVFGSALYTNQVPTSKRESQERSTQLSLAYYRANGSGVNKNHQSDRTAFESKGLHAPAGCVRLHFLLPSTPEQPPLCEVASSDVVINITSSTMQLLFPAADHKELLELLAYATCTDASDWGCS
jgi:hypothetical protein